MTNVRKLRPSELDLQAYLDNELEPSARMHIIEWLLENPISAQELFEVQLREDLLRAAVKLSVADEADDGITPSKNAPGSGVDFRRYDRFAAGFVAATAIFGIIALLTAL